MHFILELRVYNNIDFLDIQRNTPLHLAASHGHFAVCLMLIKHGADPLARNIKNQIPYDVCKRGLARSLQAKFAKLLIPQGTMSDDSSTSDIEEYNDSDTSLDDVPEAENRLRRTTTYSM